MPEGTARRGMLTLAFGKTRFIDMAKALARSLVIHDPDLPRAVVTDSNDAELRALFTDCIPYKREYGSNLRQKMHLDLYSPYDETLFIDSDCLVVHKLDHFWTAFAGVPFGVPGFRIMRPGARDEYLDVDFLLQHFSLTGLPKFNGGTYYFKRSPEAAAFFQTARSLMANYKELRLKDFRGDGPNDESLYSAALAIHGLSATDMGEGGMWTPINSKGPITLDVLRGSCYFIKEGRPVKPDIIHFATVWAETYTYRRECIKLSKLARASSGDISKANLSLAESVQLRASVLRERIPRFCRGVLRRLRRQPHKY
jgi:hypothetical protein